MVKVTVCLMACCSLEATVCCSGIEKDCCGASLGVSGSSSLSKTITSVSVTLVENNNITIMKSRGLFFQCYYMGDISPLYSTLYHRITSVTIWETFHPYTVQKIVEFSKIFHRHKNF